MMASATLAQAPIRCSQLSRTMRMSWGDRASSKVSSAGRPGWPVMPSVSVMAETTASSSRYRRQFDEPDPVARAVEELGGDLQGEPGLARSAGTGKGHQTRRSRPESRTSSSSSLPSDERRRLGGQVVGQRRIVERAQRAGTQSADPRRGAGRSAPGGPRSFKRWRPRSVSDAPAGSESRTRAAAVSESRTWPP